jgi:hypothetical protein
LAKAVRDLEPVLSWVISLSEQVSPRILRRLERFKVGGFHIGKLKPDPVRVQTLCCSKMKVEAGQGLIDPIVRRAS